jgi:putative ABC transport system permease protein
MSLWQDVRFAVRVLIKNRWFTIVAATALALGIGINTAVFTFVNAVLIRGVPFDDPDRIISLGATDNRNRQMGVSRLDFNDWRDASKSFTGLALFLGASINVSDEGRAPEQYQGAYQTANLFQLIGVKPMLGRDFRSEDDQAGAAPVALIGAGMWKNRYGSDPSIIGRTIKENSVVVTVIGIMAPDMKFPFNTDMWMPLSVLPPEARETKRGVRNFQALGKLPAPNSRTSASGCRRNTPTRTRTSARSS